MNVLAIIPTYNEIGALPNTLERLLSAQPEVDVLIVDDRSPDGTGELAERYSAEDPRIHVLHRPKKTGLGGAYIAGFSWGLQYSYDVLVEMDADGSHQPEQLARLLYAIDDADLVIGSRRVPGGGTVNWPAARQLISQVGSLYPRIMLGLNLTDITAGYRAYRATTLRDIDLSSVRSKGYAFQIDMSFRTARLGKRIVEVPITFVDRQVGESKMSSEIVAEAIKSIAQWGITARWQTLKKRLLHRS